MKLTDQEQVILRAIETAGRNGLALIANVVKAVGYPKATTKKVLISLSNKGAVSLHRHDWPQSLKPEQRKLMIKIGNDYFNAVSMRKRNPEKKSKGKTALKTTGRALKKAAGGLLGAGAQILGAGAMALNPVRRKTAKAGKAARRRNLDHKDSTHQIEVRKHWRAGGLSQWQRAHHAGQHDLFAHGIKAKPKRNPKGPLPTPQNREEYKIFYEELHRLKHLGPSRTAIETALMKKIQSALTRYDKGLARAKKNASRTVSTAKTAKRRSAVAGKASRKAAATAKVRSVAKTRKAPTRRATSNPTRKGMRKLYREAKRISKVTRGRYFSSESGQRKAARHEKRHARKSKHNPSAESIRKNFAGQINGERDLFFPQGTPAGKLAKLGKLVSITTEEGTIKPVNGSAWLCADTRGKLHIGSISNAPLFNGPARNFGKVKKLEYESSKPHLGYKGPIIWFHKVGEENGIRPTLRADGKGGLVFKGGDYRLTERGIEN